MRRSLLRPRECPDRAFVVSFTDFSYNARVKNPGWRSSFPSVGMLVVGVEVPRLTDEILQALLPRSTPEPRSPVDIGEEPFAYEYLGRGRDIYSWVRALQDRIEREHWERIIPGFVAATYGFIPIIDGLDLPDGLRSVGGYVFGVAFELELTEGGEMQVAEQFDHDGTAIARILNRRKIQLHVPDPKSPRAGTGACWARSRKSAIRPSADGVLTAGHVVEGLPLRSSVVMTSPGLWHLGDRGSCKIDAALIVQQGCIPAGAGSLGVQTNPVAGMRVSFYGAASKRTVEATITHSQTHPTLFIPKHPMRIFMDNYGEHGDSGALVREEGTGFGVGIYMGMDEIPPSPQHCATAPRSFPSWLAAVWRWARERGMARPGIGPKYQGVAQALSQAQYELQVDLFDPLEVDPFGRLKDEIFI